MSCADQRGEGAQRDGRGLRRVPGAAEGFVMGADRNHRAADVIDEADAVRHIGVGEHLDLLAFEERPEEPLTHQRLGDVRTDQVRRAHAGGTHLSRAVRRE